MSILDGSSMSLVSMDSKVVIVVGPELVVNIRLLDDSAADDSLGPPTSAIA